MRVLHHIPLSPHARKVRLVLAEKRLPFELRFSSWLRTIKPYSLDFIAPRVYMTGMVAYEAANCNRFTGMRHFRH